MPSLTRQKHDARDKIAQGVRQELGCAKPDEARHMALDYAKALASHLTLEELQYWVRKLTKAGWLDAS